MYNELFYFLFLKKCDKEIIKLLEKEHGNKEWFRAKKSKSKKSNGKNDLITFAKALIFADNNPVNVVTRDTDFMTIANLLGRRKKEFLGDNRRYNFDLYYLPVKDSYVDHVPFRDL